MLKQIEAGALDVAYERRVIPLVGHNLPQEAPREFARAVLDVTGDR